MTKYQKLKNARVCVQCGKLPIFGKTQCQKCIDKRVIHDKIRYKKKAEKGLCVTCGKPAIFEKTQCQKCIDKRAIYDKIRYKKRAEKGLCVACKNPAIPGKTQCYICSITSSLRSRIYQIIKMYNTITTNHTSKADHTFKLVGCFILEFIEHIESQFTEGMTLENYGEWHIDHIKPLSLFDLSKEEEQYKAFHYTNLQPLWAYDNISKGNKYESTFKRRPSN